MLYLFITLITTILVMGGVIIALIIFHYREKKEVFNRFMAKNFSEYNYFDKEFPEKVRAEAEKKKLDMELKKRVTPAQRLSSEHAEQF